MLGSLRTVLHIAGKVDRHQIGPYAGGLTMTTLLAKVPLFAVSFSIAKGFGFGDELDQKLVEFAADLPPHFQEVVQKLREVVAGADFQKLGLLSSVVVLYTGLSLFVRVERGISNAWQATAARSWLRRFSDFVALVIVVPVLGAAGLTLSSLLKSAESIETWRQSFPWLGWLYEAGLGFLPHTMLGLAFTSLYKFMPNTPVKWRPALVGGFAGGFAFMFMHGFYLDLQVGVARNNAIYATLAALPLLIIYLQVAWTIVLVGAELSYAVQNVSILGSGEVVRTPSQALRERIALSLTEHAVRGFESGERGVKLSLVASDLDVPRSLIASICRDLEKAAILATTGRDRVLPARPGERISADDVLRAIRGELPERLRARIGLSDSLEQAIDGAERAQSSALETVRFST